MSGSTMASVPSPDGRDADEYGIEWSDGMFSGPFDRQSDVAGYLSEAPEGVTGRVIARVVEYGPWSAL